MPRPSSEEARREFQGRESKDIHTVIRERGASERRIKRCANQGSPRNAATKESIFAFGKMMALGAVGGSGGFGLQNECEEALEIL